MDVQECCESGGRRRGDLCEQVGCGAEPNAVRNGVGEREVEVGDDNDKGKGCTSILSIAAREARERLSICISLDVFTPEYSYCEFVRIKCVPSEGFVVREGGGRIDHLTPPLPQRSTPTTKSFHGCSSCSSIRPRANPLRVGSPSEAASDCPD